MKVLHAASLVNFERYPEMRKDPITNAEAIIASSRALRERKPTKIVAYSEAPPKLDNACPFCPGNESQTPPELFRLPLDAPSWQLRVVDNLFPSFVIIDPKNWKQKGFFDRYRRPAIGAQRVAILHPRHDFGLTHLNTEELVNALNGVIRCYADLEEDERYSCFSCFANYGATAASTQQHLHWQIEATKELDEDLKATYLRIHKHLLEEGACLVCRVIHEERELGLTVSETEDFIASVPFAALYPYHTRIFPKHHHSSYVHHWNTGVGAKEQFAFLLKEVLSRIKACLQCETGKPVSRRDLDKEIDPPYNLEFYTDRYRTRHEAGSFHYFVDITPRTTQYGGRELKTHFAQIINPNIPEESAGALRNIGLSNPAKS